MKHSRLLTFVLLPPVLLGLFLATSAQAATYGGQALVQPSTCGQTFNTQADKEETRVVTLDITGMT